MILVLSRAYLLYLPDRLTAVASSRALPLSHTAPFLYSGVASNIASPLRSLPPSITITNNRITRESKLSEPPERLTELLLRSQIQISPHPRSSVRVYCCFLLFDAPWSTSTSPSRTPCSTSPPLTSTPTPIRANNHIPPSTTRISLTLPGNNNSHSRPPWTTKECLTRSTTTRIPTRIQCRVSSSSKDNNNISSNSNISNSNISNISNTRCNNINLNISTNISNINTRTRTHVTTNITSISNICPRPRLLQVSTAR